MAKQKKPEEVKPGLPAWQGTYGDMVTLLLCFFVLMFSMSTVDAKKFEAIVAALNNQTVSITNLPSNTGILQALGNGVVQMPDRVASADDIEKAKEQAQHDLEQIASDFKTYFAENNLQDKIEVEQNDQYITLNFKDGILFDSGSADIKSGALNVLGKVADELLKYPENDIKIEGHTDNRPINTTKYPNNWYLSAARAISVATYFTDVKSFEPIRVSTEGFGEYRPKAPNDTPENRSINRRVEIKIMSKYLSE